MENLKWLMMLHVCLMCGSIAHSARILAMFPFFPRSHYRVFQPIFKTLAQAGHEVVVYSPFPLEHPEPNYIDVHLENITTGGDKLNQFILEITALPSWQCLDNMWLIYEMVYREFMEDKNVKALLSSQEKFDLIITEAHNAQEYIPMLGHIFKAPTIALQAFFTNSLVNSHSGNSLSLSHMPDKCFGYSNKMTFTERILNAFAILRGLYFYYNTFIPKFENVIQRDFPNMPPLLDLMNNISLTFVNDHLTADYAQSRPPNIIPVAGIHIQSEKPLPKHIKKFLDEAPDGVILFSLGTYVPDELQPREYFDMYINMFRRLQQRVLWKTRKENIDGLPDNVMTVKWMPQQDVLAHPNCVLFITHGGLLSQHEAIYFGVPVVAIPQFFDQHRNVRFYEEKEIGVKIDIKDLSESTISAALQTVLSDPGYRENMKRLSRIFRDRPLSPAETVVFWTEYVLRHGGAGHLRPASTQLRWYQLTLLDVLASILFVIIAIVAISYLFFSKLLTVILQRKKLYDDFTKKKN